MKPFAFITISLPLVFAAHLPDIEYGGQSHWDVADIKVPVQLGVMSRCPDALLCESRFNDVLEKVGNKVDLSLVYIAK